MVIRMIKIAFYHQEVYEYCYHKQTMHPQKNADMVLSSSHACCQILQVFDKTSDFAIKNIAQLHPVCFFFTLDEDVHAAYICSGQIIFQEDNW